LTRECQKEVLTHTKQLVQAGIQLCSIKFVQLMCLRLIIFVVEL